MEKLLLFIGIISISGFSQECVYPVLANFECTTSSLLTTFNTNALNSISNSFIGGINASANISEYTHNGTDVWDHIKVDYGTSIDLSFNNVLNFKIYTTTPISVLAKLEGGSANREINTGSITVGSWQQFSLDFSAYANNNSGGDGNIRLIIFFNPGAIDETVSDIYYFDDLKWTSSVLSTEDISVSKQILAFPNPIRDTLIICSSYGITKINVIDVSGKTILTNEAFNSTFL